MRLVHGLGVLVVSIVLLSGCQSITIGSKPRSGGAPPPHAPAHGYRHKHHGGGELRFNSELGVYAVVGLPSHFYLDGLFFRIEGDSWQVSARLDGHWEHRSSSSVPPGLRSKRHGKSKDRTARGHPPGKAGW